MSEDTNAILRLIRAAKDYLDAGERLAPMSVQLEALSALEDVGRRFLPPHRPLRLQSDCSLGRSSFLYGR